jgi:two-component system LytT family response regulator
VICRVFVVDDEPLARRRLRRLLQRIDDVELAGEARDGRSAPAAIASAKPDLVLLDVQMPERDGFGVLAALEPPRPMVVFVTAFDAFALQAFDVHAVDYLLKPVSEERLARAIARARERLAGRPGDQDRALAALLEHVARPRRWIERLPIRSQGRVEIVNVAAIDWIEAADNYAIVHVGRRTHVLRETIARLESSLDPAAFARIHRSTIVRLDRIRRLDVALRGDYDVTLADGTTLTLSRTYRASLERALGRKL